MTGSMRKAASRENGIRVAYLRSSSNWVMNLHIQYTLLVNVIAEVIVRPAQPAYPPDFIADNPNKVVMSTAVAPSKSKCKRSLRDKVNTTGKESSVRLRLPSVQHPELFGF